MHCRQPGVFFLRSQNSLQHKKPKKEIIFNSLGIFNKTNMSKLLSSIFCCLKVFFILTLFTSIWLLQFYCSQFVQIIWKILLMQEQLNDLGIFAKCNTIKPWYDHIAWYHVPLHAVSCWIIKIKKERNREIEKTIYLSRLLFTSNSTILFPLLVVFYLCQNVHRSGHNSHGNQNSVDCLLSEGDTGTRWSCRKINI